MTEIETGRSGVITSFSAGGPSAFGHQLKPDVAAPGGEILSATLRQYTGGSPFANFDGTSMSAPHVTGAVALLTQRHPDWSVRQMKSALMSTAGAAWGNSARTQEASVLLEGAGPRERPGRRQPADLHRAGLAVLRRHEPARRRDLEAAAPVRQGRGRRRRDVDGAAPAAVRERGRDARASLHRDGRAGRRCRRPGHGARRRRRAEGRQLRIRRAPPGRDDAPRPVRVLRHSARPALASPPASSAASRRAARGRASPLPTSTASPRRRSATRPTTASGRTCARTAGSACTRSACATGS